MTTEKQPDPHDRLERAIVATSQMFVPEASEVNDMLSRFPVRTSAEPVSPSNLPPCNLPPSNVSPRTSLTQSRLRSFGPTFAKLAALSAVVVIAALVAINSPSQTAMAKVIAKVKSHRLVRCELDTSAKIKFKMHADKEAEFVDATSHETVYFDLMSPRFRVDRVEQTLNNTVDSEWTFIQDNQANRILVSSSMALVVTESDTKDFNQLQAIAAFRESKLGGKIARIFRVSDDGVKPFLHRNSDQTLLDMLDQLQSQSGIESVADEVNGKPANKYVFVNGDDIITLWVDPQAQLPVRIEEQQRSPHADAEFYKWTYSDFQWDNEDVELEVLFSTEPAAGYVVEDHFNAQ